MKNYSERISHINDRVNAARESSNTHMYTIKNWRDDSLSLPIVTIDSEYLMFRISNGRTDIQQLAYIRNSNLDKSFFNDGENPEVQDAQESILLNMVLGKGKDLIDDLSERKQEDPCIITHDGFIVNGNRRTSALKYLNVHNIKCVVLPKDANEKDIYLLEQQLQISRSFREDYHWINELKNIRRGLNNKQFGINLETLASNLRLDVTEVIAKRRTLDLIDGFLEWKNRSGEYDYDKLDSAEEAFRQLEIATRKDKYSIEKEKSLMNAVFTIIDSPPASGRMYSHVRSIIKHFDELYKRKNDQPLTDNPKSEKLDEDDPFSAILEDTDNESILFDASDNTDQDSSDIIKTIDDIKSEQDATNNREDAFNKISVAIRNINGVSISEESTKLAESKNMLQEIIVSCEMLIKKIEDN